MYADLNGSWYPLNNSIVPGYYMGVSRICIKSAAITIFVSFETYEDPLHTKMKSCGPMYVYLHSRCVAAHIYLVLWDRSNTTEK